MRSWDKYLSIIRLNVIGQTLCRQGHGALSIVFLFSSAGGTGGVKGGAALSCCCSVWWLCVRFWLKHTALCCRIQHWDSNNIITDTSHKKTPQTFAHRLNQWHSCNVVCIFYIIQEPKSKDCLSDTRWATSQLFIVSLETLTLCSNKVFSKHLMTSPLPSDANMYYISQTATCSTR